VKGSGLRTLFLSHGHWSKARAIGHWDNDSDQIVGFTPSGHVVIAFSRN
jgi:hypothetical protein